MTRRIDRGRSRNDDGREADLRRASDADRFSRKDGSRTDSGLDEATIDDASLYEDQALRLPSLDSENEEETNAGLDAWGPDLDEAAVDLDEAAVDLDDSLAEEAAEAVVDVIADVETHAWETSEGDPIEADEDLEPNEDSGWTQGSDRDDEPAVDLEAPPESEDGLDDDGREGPDDEHLHDLELPPLREGPAEEEYPDETELGRARSS